MTKKTDILATHQSPHVLPSRREALGVIGAFSAFGAMVMLSCGDDSGSTDSNGSVDAGYDPGFWATGGTAAMTAAASYPNPFASGIGSTCNLTCEATLGPCYANTLVRKDITEGHDGLPVRLAFLVVDETCKPIEGASVDIWHAAPEGLYSGEDASTFCTADDPSATSARWFRGVQTTDANGRVDFDTCFPGWYSSRTIHIHFTIRVNGSEYVTSQLVFDDVLNDDVINNQPLYKDRGPRDTTNSNDTVVSADSAADCMLQTQRMPDGAMLAWKTLVIRSSLSNASCQIPGGSGGGGGGPPPGGDGGMGPPPGDGGVRPPRDGGMGPPPGTDAGV